MSWDRHYDVARSKGVEDLAARDREIAALKQTLAARDTTIAELRGAIERFLSTAEDRPELAARCEKMRAYLSGNSFIDAYIVLGQQRGFASDALGAAGLCRATWGEEQLWRSFGNLPQGPLGKTAIMFAARVGDVTRMRFLRSCGAKVAAQCRAKGQFSWAPVSPLGFAAAAGHEAAVRELLAMGAPVDDGEVAGEGGVVARATPLLLALLNSHDAAAAALVELNAAAEVRCAVSASPGHEVLTRKAAPLALASPLLIACHFGLSRTAAALLSRGVRVEEAHATFGSPLAAACSSCMLPLVARLLDAGASVPRERAFERRSLSPLHALATLPLSARDAGLRAERLFLVARLLDGGADVNAAAFRGVLGEGRTALHAAVGKDPTLAALLIERGALLDAPYESRRSPLQAAVEDDDLPSVREWCALGAARCGDGKRVLEQACERAAAPLPNNPNALAIAEVLLDGGAAVTAGVLLAAAKSRSRPLLERAVAKGAPGALSGEALCLAVARDEVDALTAMIDVGASVEAPHAFGGFQATPLAFAGRSVLSRRVYRRRAVAGAPPPPPPPPPEPTAFEALRARGAHLDAPAGGALGPLHMAAAQGKTTKVRALLAMGALVDGAPGAPFTPLIAALLGSHSGAALALLKAGAAPNAVGPSGVTPLILAASSGSASHLAVELLARGARWEPKLRASASAAESFASFSFDGARFKGFAGASALALAASAGNAACAKLLHEKGARVAGESVGALGCERPAWRLASSAALLQLLGAPAEAVEEKRAEELKLLALEAARAEKLRALEAARMAEKLRLFRLQVAQAAARAAAAAAALP